MGIYLNPNNTNFTETLRSGLYVDKTMMISAINKFIGTQNKYVCISRPRRFGKTIAGNMLAAYYSKGADSRELFAPYKIAKEADFESNLNKFNVIQIDVNSEYRNVMEKDKFLYALTDSIREEMKKAFPTVAFTNYDSIAQCILKAYAETGEQFIIIMDEYDVLVREEVSKSLFTQYLDFLNGLFKSNTLRPAIALAYLTGILPIVRDRVQSKLNNFREYTILNAGPLAEYIGFTDEEVQELCKKHDIDYYECKRWYDGYAQNGLEIYNPESVICSIENRDFANYWCKTSTYAVINDLIQQNFDGTKDYVIRMLAGESVDVNVTRFMNTMTDFSSRNDVFTYLIHVGYLAFVQEGNIISPDHGMCRIPNREVRFEWFNAMESNADYKVTNEIIQSSRKLLEETFKGNEEAVAKALDVSHIHVTSNRSYNNEDALQSAIYLAYIYALNKYTVVKEMTTGKGFADVVFIPFYENDPAMIIELKKNGSTESAIKQIREKQYFASMEHYKGKLLFVGINYDEKDKTHTCKIEELEVVS